MTEKPAEKIFEVTLLGTGGGYGESIVIHLGNDNWAVIDSCINPKTKESLPLKYLKDKGVNLKTNVKLIICSHWHDDHILGLSDLLKECESAVFSMTKATDRKKFILMLQMDYEKIQNEGSISSTREINKCLNILRGRNSILRPAEQDKLLFRDERDGIISEIYALTPSDFIMNEFDMEISELISDYGEANRKIIKHSPNDKSVVTLIKVNNHSILLGSDLEVSKDERKGWLCILNNCQCIGQKRASLFKIPHHGSDTGYNERIWGELLTENVVAKYTPWNRGEKLPEEKMVNKYLDHTDKLYTTSSHKRKPKPKKRNNEMNKAIEQFNNSLREVKFEFGAVRCRINAIETNGEWEVDLFGSAERVIRA